ncbi:nuclear receptor-binding factor 2-like [Planococcus citri]|uniref:nuclear receptor-binding factor 2-like n=1 Tax=Planococcus citri TaxID=170843 RepID=UPI0031F855C7
MDDLNYQHSLNVAHRYARAADNHEKVRNFDEASKCHQQAIDYIQLSFSHATFAVTLESLKLQEDYHHRQKHILRLKKIQYGIHQKLLAHKQKQMALAQAEIESSDEKDKDLQWAIFKNMEAVDSLIDALIERDTKTNDEESSELSKSPSYNTAIKHPKNDSTVIEELHTLNNKLRELISQLLSQLDESQKEVASLKEKLKYYESTYPKQEQQDDQNLIDFNSLSSSVESVPTIP